LLLLPLPAGGPGLTAFARAAPLGGAARFVGGGDGEGERDSGEDRGDASGDSAPARGDCRPLPLTTGFFLGADAAVPTAFLVLPGPAAAAAAAAAAAGLPLGPAPVLVLPLPTALPPALVGLLLTGGRAPRGEGGGLTDASRERLVDVRLLLVVIVLLFC
jgi:hypothetical protein